MDLVPRIKSIHDVIEEKMQRYVQILTVRNLKCVTEFMIQETDVSI